RAHLRPAHRRAAQVRQPAHGCRRAGGRSGGRRGRRADQRGAEKAAGRDGREKLPGERAVGGPESGRCQSRDGAGAARAGKRRPPAGRRYRGCAAALGSTAGNRRLAKRRRGPKLGAMTTPSDSPLALAQTRLLAPAGLDSSGLERAFGALLGPGIDFGDLYFQHARREAWTVEDGIVKDGAHSIEQGVGVRAISGEKTGFAYSDDINGDALLA